MGYIEKNLTSGEKVVFKTKLHWMLFFWSIIFLALGIYLIIVSGEANPAGGFFGAMFFLFGIVKFIMAIVRFLTAEFGITNKRVIIKDGLIKRISLELNLDKIEGIGVEQGIFGRILGYGTILITGTGGTKQPLKKISKPLDFRKKVQEYQNTISK